MKKMLVLAVAMFLLVPSMVLAGQSCVPKTGQTTSYTSGDDGDLRKGLAWLVPRFLDNGDGTVTDNLTGLIWLKDANCYGTETWADALTDCNSLADGICGLSDGSQSGDWRLPNVRELHGLIDFGSYDPALPNGHPFTNLQSSRYWSSTTYAQSTSSAWSVGLGVGQMAHYDKTQINYVFPVRGDSCRQGTCVLTPVDTVVRKGIDRIRFYFTLINNTGEEKTFWVATAVIRPDGVRHGNLVGPLNKTLGPHASQTAIFWHDVPSYSPTGTYTYHGYVLQPDGGIHHECQFAFDVVEP